MNDLELIEQLEKEIRRKLEKVSPGEQMADSFAVNAHDHVKELFIYDKNLDPFPAALAKLKHLERLTLYHCNVRDISGLKELKGLTALDLSRNQVSDISPLNELKGLTYLGLSRNQISDISSLKELRGLTTLTLNNNQIRDVSCLNELKGLKELYLFENKISDISSLKELKSLTTLALNYNQISDISSLKELKGLRELELGGNQISDISSLKEMKELTLLDLRYNKIAHLPPECAHMGLEIKWEYDDKDGIFLEGNRLESPPVEIIEQGTKAVREYFKALEGKEKQALNEVKVLLVGDGGAGKTSLVNQLLGEDFDKDESQTHGIKIDTWEITEGETTIKVRLWDFGGQEIMHATHQFFLSKRSLYILVLDGRKDEKTEYWLNHIKSFGGDSPVMVVINKIDQNPGFDVNRRFLQDKYPNIRGFYRVSCAKGKGVEAFKKELTEQLAAVELIRTEWAKTWFNVKTRLEEMTDHVISYDRYQTICREEKVDTEAARDTLVDFLNDLGVILHFKDFQLEDTHVLEPKWITNAVYKIINSDILSAGKGVLELSRLKDILKPKRGEENTYQYPPDKYPYIFQLMKKFELCYTIDENRILVPDLLTVGEPAFKFDYNGALKFRFHYDFLPKSIMPRFIVKRHKDIKNQLRWRTGVVLEDKGFYTAAVVKADEREQKIFVYVNGSQKRDYFATIRKTFADIHDSFEKLEVEEWIPLPEQDKLAVEYKELIGYELAGKDEIFMGKLGKSYSVSQLLAGIEKPEERKHRGQEIIKERDMYTSPPERAKAPEKEKWYQKFLWLIVAALLGAIVTKLVGLF